MSNPLPPGIEFDPDGPNEALANLGWDERAIAVPGLLDALQTLRDAGVTPEQFERLVRRVYAETPS